MRAGPSGPDAPRGDGERAGARRGRCDRAPATSNPSAPCSTRRTRACATTSRSRCPRSSARWRRRRSPAPSARASWAAASGVPSWLFSDRRGTAGRRDGGPPRDRGRRRNALATLIRCSGPLASACSCWLPPGACRPPARAPAPRAVAAFARVPGRPRARSAPSPRIVGGTTASPFASITATKLPSTSTASEGTFECGGSIRDATHVDHRRPLRRRRGLGRLSGDREPGSCHRRLRERAAGPRPPRSDVSRVSRCIPATCARIASSSRRRGCPHPAPASIPLGE